MKVHTTKYFSMYTDYSADEGGLADIAHVELIGFTLIKNEDLVRLRNVASALDNEPIPAHIMEVLGLCANALRKTNTQKAKAAMASIKDLLKGAAS